MLQEQLLAEIKGRGLRVATICRELDINRQNFYKAIASANLENPTLVKLLTYLDLEVSISLHQRHGNIRKTLRTTKSQGSR